jgi:histidinol-phosphatase (PHP family)
MAPPIIDYHVHESHSRDAPTATLPSLVAAAEARGVEEMALTTHLILEGPDAPLGVQTEELDGYFRGIEEAQRGTGVRLRAGLEVDYFPSRERQIGAIVDEHPLDFVLGSTHYVNGVDIGSRVEAAGFFSGRPLSEAADEYFTVWMRAVESGLFDVMAHPDYWRKFLHTARAEPAAWGEYGSVVADAIGSLAGRGVGVEVNTSATRHGLVGFYPVREFLVAARAAGVRRVTLGSDTHAPELLGYLIPEAAMMLRELGFTRVSTFKGRVNSSVSLSRLLPEGC